MLEPGRGDSGGVETEVVGMLIKPSIGGGVVDEAPRPVMVVGLTLRDYVACCALNPALQCGVDIASEDYFLEIARSCYKMADAMLVASREVKS